MPVPLPEFSQAVADRYRILSEAGRGGMATVFLADDLRHGRHVAIKVLEPEIAAAIGRERFRREIQLTARLTHPHIVPLYDSGEAGGFLYYVMPLVEGESLRERLDREKQLPADEALRITREIGAALAYAHEHGLVHRDMKPENILMSPSGAMLSDFGIAYAIDTEDRARLTSTGVTLGTPTYMSPEQIVGGGVVDGRSDQYSLACVAYEMLAGVPPFSGPHGHSLAHQHLSVTPRPVTELRPNVPRGVSDALAKALAKAPADRFGGVAEFSRALDSAALAPLPPTGGRPASRSRRRVLIAALAVLALGAVGVRWWAWQTHEAAPSQGPRAWVLVADFDAPATDPDLGPAARELTSAALDQSPIVATVPSADIKLALRSAGRPDTTRITPDLGRELAYRRSIRAVLEGSVTSIGSRYAVALRLWDAERDSLLFTGQETARGKNELIPAVTKLARQLRTMLGEKPSSVRATRDRFDTQTSSYEAFRLIVQARRLQDGGDDASAVDCARRALALDPAFAAAVDMMTIAFLNMGMTDSVNVYMSRGKRMTRRTEDQEAGIEALRIEVESGPEEALAAWGRFVRRFPNHFAGHNNYAVALAAAGRHAESLAEYRTAATLLPFGPNLVAVSGVFWELVLLGRSVEAGTLVDSLHHLEHPSRSESSLARLAIDLAAERWGAVDSLGQRTEPDPGISPFVRIWSAALRAGALGARGELHAADAILAPIPERYAATGDAEDIALARRIRAFLVLMAPWMGPPGTGRPDTSLTATISEGFTRAARGDWEEARACLARIRARGVRASHAGDGPLLLEAVIAAHEHRWRDVLDLLVPAERAGCEHTYTWGIGMRYVSWQLARAFEATGQPDSAIVYDALAIQPHGIGDFVPQVGRPLIQLRIVANALRIGRLDLARQTWTEIERDVDHPDPEVAQLIAEQRAALANALATSRPSRN